MLIFQKKYQNGIIGKSIVISGHEFGNNEILFWSSRSTTKYTQVSIQKTDIDENKLITDLRNPEFKKYFEPKHWWIVQFKR